MPSRNLPRFFLRLLRRDIKGLASLPAPRRSSDSLSNDFLLFHIFHISSYDRWCLIKETSRRFRTVRAKQSGSSDRATRVSNANRFRAFRCVRGIIGSRKFFVGGKKCSEMQDPGPAARIKRLLLLVRFDSSTTFGFLIGGRCARPRVPRSAAKCAGIFQVIGLDYDKLPILFCAAASAPRLIEPPFDRH